jgi:hypothetical protein
VIIVMMGVVPAFLPSVVMTVVVMPSVVTIPVITIPIITILIVVAVMLVITLMLRMVMMMRMMLLVSNWRVYCRWWLGEADLVAIRHVHRRRLGEADLDVDLPEILCARGQTRTEKHAQPCDDRHGQQSVSHRCFPFTYKEGAEKPGRFAIQTVPLTWFRFSAAPDRFHITPPFAES